MQEEEVEEILILMTEKMLRMEQELEKLNEKQNVKDDKGNDNAVSASKGSDSSKQLTIDDL